MIVIGADAGGTKTAAAVWKDGEQLARSDGAPGAVRPGRALAAASAIIDACRQALSVARLARGDTLVVGAAGVGRPSERDELALALRAEGICERVIVVTDIELVLAAAFDHGPGIALAAGTGSIAVSRSAEGALLRSGGYGWQMGDEGSGYAIGRAALTAVSRAQDGRGRTTVLSTLLPGAARVPDFDALVSWAATATPAQVASLAPAVLGATSDDVAGGIVAAAADDLAKLVTSLRSRAPQVARMPVAYAGSLLAQAAFRAKVTAALMAADGVEVRDGVVEPLQGVPRLAR
jgi:N-acetylglucosamine kinase-like BadF-type ATPase